MHFVPIFPSPANVIIGSTVLRDRNLEQTIRDVIKAMRTTAKAVEISVIQISCSLSDRDRSNNELSVVVAWGGALPVGTVCVGEDDGVGTVGISITHVHG